MRFMYSRAFLLLAGAVAPLVAFGQPIIMDEIVCKVNGDIVTRSELERSKKDMEGALREQGLTGAKLAEAIAEETPKILQRRIDDLLLEQKAKELDIKVDTEIDKQIAEIKRRAKITDEEKFQQFVREETGMPYEDYRGVIKNKLLRDRVMGQEISRKISFKREDLEAYYNAHKDEFERQERVILSEIFISTIGMDDAGKAVAEKKAKDLVAKANKGGQLQRSGNPEFG